MVFNPIYYVMAFGARITILLGILLIPGIQTTITAQLSGTKTIPGNYATIAAAVTDLNAQGVGAGGVTFNVAAGHIEISDIPVLNATGTVANPILFQKSGMGANPKIQPLTAGTVASWIFQISPAYELRLKDMALINATSVTNGGAIYAEGKLKLENVRFTNNTENGVPKSLSLVSTGMLTITSGNVEMNQ